jgi:hypothetical protein
MSASDVATVCAALGRIGPPAAAAAAAAAAEDTCETLQALITAQQSGMSLRQLSDCLWGLGKAGLAAEGRWVGRLWAHMIRRSRQVRISHAHWQ